MSALQFAGNSADTQPYWFFSFHLHFPSATSRVLVFLRVLLPQYFCGCHVRVRVCQLGTRERVTWLQCFVGPKP